MLNSLNPMFCEDICAEATGAIKDAANKIAQLNADIDDGELEE